MLIMRNYKFDNIKGILILLVVFAHFIEGISSTEYVYKFIYIFHMPLFIFVSGYFGKFDKKKLILHLVYPYIVFQLLDLCFDAIYFTPRHSSAGDKTLVDSLVFICHDYLSFVNSGTSVKKSTVLCLCFGRLRCGCLDCRI